ncbi:TIGR04283 family arsenosugar biosynthesis glycosyltransferase [Ramlibacter rhizophilus]|uniref:TIGR04283 family arsenosugar biosynthesis glycosyltransferase n=1 Tax=Ramlibacter rhizophilus TaxID=1781167 RepID=UPI0014326656|nr:TIGR04283 family arsenosugar biosynthesis glycosyltransferase [Ramlibacter rhizophilus]
MISVIVPLRNEAALVREAVEALRAQAGDFELLLADGGSTDGTLEIAQALPGVRCVRSAPGRGVQMNAAAAVARGSVFLFLHVDTRLEPGALLALERAVAAGLQAGAFTHRFDHPDWRLRLVSWGHNLSCRIGRIYYGDHGIFVTRELFERVGGFPEVPVLEDVMFCERLRRHARGRLLAPVATTGARRFLQLGVWRTTARGLWILAQHRLGRVPDGRGFREEVR